MPVVFEKKEDSFSIGIWQSTESLEELLVRAGLKPVDRQTWDGFKSIKRKIEWLAVRVLLKKIFDGRKCPEIKYDEKGKPHLDNGDSISISHTREFVAVMVSPMKHAGIDIETIYPRIEDLSRKFLSDEEKKSVPESHRLEFLHIIWGAKEVMFKIYGNGEMDFKTHLLTKPFLWSTNGMVNSSIRKNEFELDLDIHFLEFRDMMLVYGVC